jgi:hypothetical protein
LFELFAGEAFVGATDTLAGCCGSRYRAHTGTSPRLLPTARSIPSLSEGLTGVDLGEIMFLT